MPESTRGASAFVDGRSTKARNREMSVSTQNRTRIRFIRLRELKLVPAFEDRGVRKHRRTRETPYYHHARSIPPPSIASHGVTVFPCSRAPLSLISVVTPYRLVELATAGRPAITHSFNYRRFAIPDTVSAMYRLLALPVALLAAYATAQTSTVCDPTKKTCPNDPALGTTFETTFNSSMTEFDPNFFNLTAGTDLISFSDSGAEMRIEKSGDSVTIETAFYIMFGTVEIIFQAAKGQGIISTVVFLSDDLDEIDIEIMGGNTTHVSNNYYGQGNTDQFNSEYPVVDWDGGAMGGMHNYTVNWSQDQIEWIMDGASVRTQPYKAPGQYPQTPCYIKFGLWAGGDPSEPKGTIQWAGGPTNYDDG